MMVQESHARKISFEEYESLLRSLHYLIAQGKGDGNEADAIRDAMDGPWWSLSDAERKRLEGLSADLYLLQGEEIGQPGDRPLSEAEVRRQLEEARNRGDWEVLLHVLRQAPQFFPPAQRAIVRARAYEELGQLETALEFARYAVRTEPDRWHNAAGLVHILMNLGRFEDALEEATRFAANADRSGIAAITSILYSATRTFCPERLSEACRWIIQYATPRGISDADERSVDPLADSVLIILALANEVLGDTEGALRAYDAYIKKHPKDATVLITRGVLRSELSDRRALEDFRKAEAVGTSSYIPYAYLAQESMRANDFQRAIRYAEQVVQRGAKPRTLALVYTWLAIAHYQTGSPGSTVDRFLRIAVELDPLSEQIRQTEEQLRSAMSDLVRSGSASELVFPILAIDAHQRSNFDVESRLPSMA